MRNVLRVCKRDILRLLHAPAALVVVIALIVLPSLYTWFNVVGFWNPYDNTGNLRVCVVNEDAGATSSLTGDLHLGDQIVAEMQSNDQLGWEFTDRETATDEVASGRAYAAFVIPSDFSYNFTTLFSGDVHQPQLEYYVNEKEGAVAPKITDTGATMLDQTINSTFVSTVSSTVADTLDKALQSYGIAVGSSEANIASLFEKANGSICEARSSVAGLNGAVSGVSSETGNAKAALAEARESIVVLSDELARVSALTTQMQNDLGRFSTRMISVMGESSILVSQAAAKTNTAIGGAAGSVVAAQGNIRAAIESGRAAAAQNTVVIDKLKDIYNAMPDSPEKTTLGDTIASLETQNADFKDSLDELEVISQDTEAAATSIAAASNDVNTAAQATIANMDEYREMLSTTTLPAINGGLSQIAATASSLSMAVIEQTRIIDQAQTTLDELAATLSTTSAALMQTDTMLASLSSSLDTVKTDLVALGTSDALGKLLKNGSVDAGKIADFMLSPTELTTETLYQLNAYGSAMAPLFMNLTLWIGVFMLMVILKQEVDDEGVEGLTVAQRYWSRWLFLAPLVALQAIVCCAGNLVIGVQTANVFLFFLTAIIASLTYLSIQYALSLTLQHIGKGICIILVFVQIPGATGLYPVEMIPDFFQAVYPAFPFTYGINAIRETIGGFYGWQWAQLVGALLLFLVISFAVGLLVRPYCANLNRMFAREIKASDILNGEDVEVPEQRFRLAKLVRALSDREEYRTRLRGQAQRFIKLYPRLKAGAWVFGILVPTVAAVALSLAEGEKVILLTVWLIWLICIILFMVGVEDVRDNLERQLALDDLSDEGLRELFFKRGADSAATSITESLRQGRDE